MVTVPELWLPVLASALAVFFTSAIIRMLLRYHDNDFGKLAAEDDVLGAIRRTNAEPGEYVAPYCARGEMNSPEYIEKRSAGPVALVTVLPGGPPTMGRELTSWFVYCVVTSAFAAYITGRALEGATVDYLEVFRYAGTVAFVGYGLAIWQESIWFGRPWKTTLKSTLDALVFALLTGGIFGWLWPATTV